MTVFSGYFISEIILLLSAIGLLLRGSTHTKGNSLVKEKTAALIVGVLAIVFCINDFQGLQLEPIQDVFINSSLTLFLRIYILIASLFTIILSGINKSPDKSNESEYYFFLLLATFFMCLAVGSANLIAIFICLLAASTAQYFLIGFNKKSPIGVEAALKYYIFSFISGVCFLYATAILFFHVSSLNLNEIQTVLSTNPLDTFSGAMVFVLYLISFGFYFGVFPFHFVFPDIVQGTTTPVSLFYLLTTPLLGASVALSVYGGGLGSSWFNGEAAKSLGGINTTFIVLSLGLLTCFFGALLSAVQTNLKRLLAYLAITHVGFMFLSLLAINPRAGSVLFYQLLVYLLSLSGIFCSFSFLSKEFHLDLPFNKRNEQSPLPIVDMFCFILFLSCLIGFPPFPGAIARWMSLELIFDQGYIFAALAVLMAMIITCWTFFRVVAGWLSICTRDGNETESKFLFSSIYKRKVYLVFLIPLCGLLIFCEPIIQFFKSHLETVFW